MLCDASRWAGPPAVRQTVTARHPPVVTRLTVHTASQTTQAMVTMRKLGGMLNIADTASPNHTENRLITVETTIASRAAGSA